MFKSALIFTAIFSIGVLFVYFFLVHFLPWAQRRKVADAEMPEAWDRVLDEKLKGFHELNQESKNKIRRLVKIYMAEKFFEPDRLKWHEQILICALLAKRMHNEKRPYLSKLSTIKIGKKIEEGQGKLEVSSFEELNSIDLRRWF